MAIQIQCRCGGKYQVPDAWAGRKAHCKRCRAPLRIPSNEPEVLEAAEDDFEVVEDDFEVVEEDFEVVEEKRKPSDALKKLAGNKTAKSSKPAPAEVDEEDEAKPKPKKKKKRKLTPEQQALCDEAREEEREHRQQMLVRGFSYIGSGLMLIGVGVGAIFLLLNYRDGEVSSLPGVVHMAYRMMGPWIPGIIVILLGLFPFTLGVLNIIGIGVVISPGDDEE